VKLGKIESIPLRAKVSVHNRKLPLSYVHVMPLTRSVPVRHRNWIGVPDSITDEIGRRFGRPPALQLNFEGPDRLHGWESRLLHRPHRDRVFAREIALVVGDEVVLVARSLTNPSSPVVGMLRNLEHDPLAHVLFTDARWHRTDRPVAIAWRSGATRVFGRACFWQRTANLGGWLLVEEYFLAP
jgi:chorismate-pyruvate lyase